MGLSQLLQTGLHECGDLVCGFAFEEEIGESLLPDAADLPVVWNSGTCAESTPHLQVS